MLIYGACQVGMNINADDMAIHTLIAVNEYAAKMLNSKDKSADNSPAVPLSSLGDKF